MVLVFCLPPVAIDCQCCELSSNQKQVYILKIPKYAVYSKNQDFDELKHVLSLNETEMVTGNDLNDMSGKVNYYSKPYSWKMFPASLLRPLLGVGCVSLQGLYLLHFGVKRGLF